MNQSETISLVQKVQSGYAIEAITYKGKNVWPVMRYYFSLVLLKSFQNSSNEIMAPATPVKSEQSALAKLNRISEVFSYPLLWFQKLNQKKKLTGVDCKIAFISPSFEPYPDVIEGKRYSRYLDPYIELISKKEKVCKLQLVKKDQSFNDLYIPVVEIREDVFIKNIALKQKLLRIINHRDEKKLFYNELEKLNAHVSALGIDYEFPRWLADDLDEAYRYEKLFYDLLKGTGIQTVFFETYYSMCLFGLVSACKKLGIKTVDIQHGAIDINYLGWNTVSAGALHYLPDYYWVWSRQDQDKIAEQQVTKALRPLLGGNMWLGKFRSGNKITAANNSEKMRGGTGKTILVSFQYSFYLDYLLELMAEVLKYPEKKYSWIFRMHPLNTLEDKAKVEECLAKYPGIRYKDIEKINLYELFKTTDVHIVASSTVALEGLQFEIPTIITHPLGKDLFAELINNSVFAYADTAEAILNSIEHHKASSFLKQYKIETSDALAFTTLEQILN